MSRVRRTLGTLPHRPPKETGAPQRDVEPARVDAFERGAAPADAKTLNDAVSVAAGLRKGPDRSVGERMLTQRAADRVRGLIAGAPRASVAALAKTLRGLDTPLQRSVLLRAVAARALSITGGGSMEVIASFGDALSRLDDEVIRARSTSLDLDHGTNSSDLEPNAIWNKRGTIHDRTTGDARADNDGLIQRFTGSCGSTTLQMLLAEADPIFAFALHAEGLASDESTGTGAHFQRALLETYGGIAIGRREAQIRARLNNALGRMDLTPTERDDFRGYVFTRGARTAPARRILRAMRAKFAGFPTTSELRRIRREVLPRRDEGVASDAMLEILNTQLQANTGVRYRAKEFARGHAYRYLDEVATALRRGVDVPFGTSEPAHWMLLSAVKGRKPKRSYLVSDPYSGRTLWVPERELKRASFVDKALELASDHERPYIDAFLLPQ